MEVGGTRTRLPFAGLRTAASGLSAQRRRLEVVAENMANIESFNADGTPYRRKVIQLQTVAPARVAEAPGSASVDEVSGPEEFGRVIDVVEQLSPGGVRVLGVIEDLSEGARVYDPGHEFADENGYVTMPNVTITREYADMIDAQRLYEANASVFQAIKNMLHKATQI